MNKAGPLISIALCTYNGAEHLEEQLQSIIQQTHKNFEIIAVDDVSKDATVSILEKYQKRCNLTIFKNEQNLGYVKNFEKAIHLCKGDYIALCDQDDIWEPTKLERLLTQINNHLLIYSDSHIVNQKGEALNKKISSIRNFVKGHHPESFLFHNCVAGHTTLFSKELKKYIFPFPDHLFHDWWITFVASAVGTITYTPDCLVKYRQHEKTNTDILYLRTPKKSAETEKSKKVELRTLQIIDHLSIFALFKYLQKDDRSLVEELIEGYKNRLNHFFSWRLFIFLIKNGKNIYRIPKDPFIYKAVHLVKESFGTKLKKAFYQWKEKKSTN